MKSRGDDDSSAEHGRPSGDARGIDVGVDRLGWRGLATLLIGATFLLLLLEVTSNLLASVLGGALAAGVALDRLLRPTRLFLRREALVRSGILPSRIRYADIVDVEYEEGAGPGDRSRLRVHGAAASWSFTGRSKRDPSLAEVALRLNERLRTFRTPASVPAAPLARGARDDLRWTTELRDLVAGDRAGYRVGAVAPETLLRIAENPASSDEERVAALVALSPVRAFDARVRARIADLVPDTATPDINEALAAWLEEDEDVLERTLLRVSRAP